MGSACEQVAVHASIASLLKPEPTRTSIPLQPSPTPPIPSALLCRWRQAVAASLENDVQQVVSYWEGEERLASPTAADAQALVASVRAAQADVVAMRRELEDLEQKILADAAARVTNKQEVAEALAALLEAQLGPLATKDEEAIRHLLLTSDVVDRKLQVLAQDFLSETYNPAAVQALLVLQNHLQARLGRLKAQERVLDDKLAAYEGGGQRMQRVLEEYRNVREDVTKAQWMVHQLQPKD